MRISDWSSDVCSSDLDARASAWAIRSAERALGEQEQQELDSWLAADSRHLGAYVRAQALWLDLDRVAALDGGARRNPSPHARKRVRRRYAMAASLAVVVAGGAVAYDQLAGRVGFGRRGVGEE